MWKKLALKTQKLTVYNAPKSFQPHLQELSASCQVDKTLSPNFGEFLLAFVSTREQLKPVVACLSKCTSTDDDTVWCAYPKSKSKLKGDINRDAGFVPLGTLGFEPVTSISIDEDWSALRFRRVQYIKSMQRHTAGAMSTAGKERTKNNERTMSEAKAAEEEMAGKKRGRSKVEDTSREQEKVPAAPKGRKKGRVG